MIGIYGGTFNPVHNGHLRSALDIKNQLGLSEVRLIPCRLPPHRQLPDVSGEMRLQMLQLGVAGCPGLKIDRCELDRDGPSYMVDTLAELKAQLPTETLVLIMGLDAFLGLQRWYCWQKLFDFAHVVVMTRPGYRVDALPPDLQSRRLTDIEQLGRQDCGGLWFQPVTELAISSSHIRQLVAQNGDARYLLPDSVLDFIKQHDLYRSLS